MDGVMLETNVNDTVITCTVKELVDWLVRMQYINRYDVDSLPLGLITQFKKD